jgi:predicted dehydrogenase
MRKRKSKKRCALPVPSRVVIVGYGSAGRRHYRILSKILPSSDIYGISKTMSRKKRAAEEPHFCSFRSLRGLRPSLGVVSSATVRHAGDAMKLAKFCKAILVEKPIAMRLSQGQSMVKRCQQSGIYLAVGYNLRFLASLRKFRSLVSNGVVGQIKKIDCVASQYLPWWRASQDYRTGVSAQKRLGGGVLLELSHELDYLLWIFGPAVQVRATLRRTSKLTIDVEDDARIKMKIQRPGGQRIPVELLLAFGRKEHRRFCQVWGTKGVLLWDALKNVVTLRRGRKVGQVLFRKNSIAQTSEVMWRDFLSGWKTGRPPAVPGTDGVKVLALIESIWKSNRLGGRAVPVPTAV